MIKCPKCKKEISEKAKVCPNCGQSMKLICKECGQSFSKKDKICPNCGLPIKNNHKWFALVTVLFVIIIIFLLFSINKDNSVKTDNTVSTTESAVSTTILTTEPVVTTTTTITSTTEPVTTTNIVSTTNYTTQEKAQQTTKKKTSYSEVNEDSKIYEIGETWNADGYFKVKFTGAQKHYFCNRYTDSSDYNDVVIVTFDVENTGYNGDLLFTGSSFDLYDSSKVQGKSYACTHVDDMRTISMGYKQNDISRDFMVKNCDDYVYITIEKMISKDNGYTGDSGYIIEKATFKVTIN